MVRKKRKMPRHVLCRIVRMKRELAAVEAQIVLCEKNRSLELAKRDHFALWQRPSLFSPWPAHLVQ